MPYDPDSRHRRSIRLRGYDYALVGAYAFTLCAEGRVCLLGEVTGDTMRLSAAGEMIWRLWDTLPGRFPGLDLDEFIVMPNHVHGILVLAGDYRGVHQEGDHKDRPYDAASGRGEPCVRPSCIRPLPPDERSARPHGTATGSIGRILQALKSLATHEYIIGVREHGWLAFEGRLWQRNYYEQIIRRQRELDAIREYIANNAAQWAADRDNPHLR